ncbi:glycosyltransferase [Maribacter sp. CXY002]|uniref:glycosyltransferase n=1 Tax=Maribacter luteocoastalis TaxID=3407671 RepID=UPI003B67FFB8
MKSPLVTVYITNYNYGKFIRKAIESILNQTLKDIELIIIDDGSTDNSKDIIEEYSNHDIISIIYQKNRGLNITNNVALKASKGKYIVRLDADDYMELNALKKMSDFLENDDELGLIFPNYYIVDIDGNELSEIKRHDFKKEVNILDQPAHGACTMIRTNYLKEIGGYDESYRCQDGYELWVKFINKFKVTNINETLFSYRRHNNNLTNNENRILGTRQRIKQAYVSKNNLNLPRTTAIIPLRPNYDTALELFGNVTFLEVKINELVKATNVSEIIVTTSDKRIETFVLEKGLNVTFVKRPEITERINVSLFQTLVFLENNNYLNNSDACLFCAVSFPFVNAGIIDDAVNTLSIFKADSLISVRPEGNKFYRHTGDGMQAILKQDMFTKMERESIYKYTGGVLLSNKKSALKNGKLVHGNVGHIVVGEQASLNVDSSFERKVSYSLLAEQQIEKTTV